MIKIGELAKICNVNIQTLRYYDKIGLLKADYVDSTSGYRFYHPEKIKTYQTILQLKELAFSLEESKEFLNSSKEHRLEMYQTKRAYLQNDIILNQNKIREIERICTELNSGREISGAKILQIPFTDDPKVIGKWKLCGKLPNKVHFSPDNLVPFEEFLHQHLYFLPGGGHVWSYCWTKDILYVFLGEFNLSVPNEYRIFEHEGITYLSLNWIVDKCLHPNAEDCTLIYQQLDRRQYTEKETFSFRDQVNLPFVSDARVLGSWRTVDVVDEPQDFESIDKQITPSPHFIQRISFYDRGICVKSLPKNRQLALTYTNGLVLDRNLELAEKYRIVEKNGKEYLILEHKSGDYLYLGKVFCYYIFEKEAPNETDV
ncbi:MAG: MerR family transcriptional regulator [Clostridia bacterium]|nr:MerR family transcriptional regulator [Clostridia bacterium]